jgi:hypothetical protein
VVGFSAGAHEAQTGSKAGSVSYAVGAGGGRVVSAGLKLTVYLRLVPRLRMRRIVPQPPHPSSQLSASLSTGITLTVYTNNVRRQGGKSGI